MNTMDKLPYILCQLLAGVGCKYSIITKGTMLTCGDYYYDFNGKLWCVSAEGHITPSELSPLPQFRVPTLSELIEDCGRISFKLYCTAGRYIALVEAATDSVEYKTPEEAVAHIRLLLNNNVK